MGRPSKLTEKQWLEVERRHLDGESGRKLAAEFGVSEAAVRKRVSTQSKQIKAVANQIIATEEAVRALPLSAQLSAHNLADKLRSISMHLSHAANYGAMTSHRLSGIAHAQVERIDDNDPLGGEQSLETLKGISALTRLSNDSAEIGLNLLKANKEAIDDMNKKEDRKQPVLMTRVIGAD